MATIQMVLSSNHGGGTYAPYRAITPVCTDRMECVMEYVGVHRRVMQVLPIWSLRDYMMLFPGTPGRPPCTLGDILFVAVGGSSALDAIKQSWAGVEGITVLGVVDDANNATLETVRSAIAPYWGKFAWYLVTEGPVLVYVENLLAMLGGLDPRYPLAVGHVRRMHHDDAPLLCSSSGIAIAKAAMEIVAGPGARRCPSHHGLSDTISSCFWERGVFIADHVDMREKMLPAGGYQGSMSGLGDRAVKVDLCRRTVAARDDPAWIRTHWVECRFLHRYDDGGNQGGVHTADGVMNTSRNVGR